MKSRYRLLALFLPLLAVASLAGAAGSSRTAYVPNGNGLFHVSGGVQLYDAGTLLTSDVYGDASVGYAPVVLSDGGVAWAAVATSGGSALAGDVIGDAGANRVVALQGLPVSDAGVASYAILAGSYQSDGGAAQWQPTTIAGDATWNGTGAPSWTNNYAAGHCFQFQNGTMTLGSIASGCSGAQSIVTPAVSSGTGIGISLAPGASANGTPGGVSVNLGLPTGAGTEAQFQVQRNGAGMFAVASGPSGAYTNVWALPAGQTQTANNYVFQTDGSSAYLNSPSASGIVYLYNGNSNYAATFSQTTANLAMPSVTFLASAGNPVISQAASSTATTGASLTVHAENSTAATSVGGELDLNPGTGTSKSGNAVVTLQTTANGTEPFFKVSRNLSGTTTPFFATGHWTAPLAAGYGIWLGAQAASPTSSNFSLLDYNGQTELNSASSLQFQFNNASVMEIDNSSTIQIDGTIVQAQPNATASTAAQALSISGAANTGTGSTSSGGALNLTSGSSANGAGGNINIAGGSAGASSGAGAGGSVVIQGGVSSGGDNGTVTIESSPGGANGANAIYLGGANTNTSNVVVSAPMVGQVGAYYGQVNGYIALSVAGGSNVLVPTTYATLHYIDLTGALTANINVVLPISAGTEWCIGNLTTGAFTIKLYNGTSASSAPGTAISLTTPGSTAAAGAKCTRVWSDGTYLRLAE